MYPLTYVVALSLTSEQEWVESGGFLLWPSRPTLRAYVNVIIRTPVFTNSFLVSVARVVVGTPCILLFTMTMGYMSCRAIACRAASRSSSWCWSRSCFPAVSFLPTWWSPGSGC